MPHDFDPFFADNGECHVCRLPRLAHDRKAVQEWVDARRACIRFERDHQRHVSAVNRRGADGIDYSVMTDYEVVASFDADESEVSDALTDFRNVMDTEDATPDERLVAWRCLVRLVAP